MLIRVFQIVLVVLVVLFTLVGLTLLLSGLQSTLIANAGISSFTLLLVHELSGFYHKRIAFIRSPLCLVKKTSTLNSV